MHQSGRAACRACRCRTYSLGSWPLVVSIVDGVSELGRPSGQHVDDGVLYERRENEHEADDHPDVDGFDVGDTRQRRPSTTAHRRRRQHGQQAEGHARWTRVDVDPERNPRQNDDKDRRNVDLNEKVADVAAKYKQDLKTGKCT